MISRNQYPNFTLSITGLLSLLLLISPVSLFSQDSSPPSPDFNGNGVVDASDLRLLIGVYGAMEGEERYDAKYDLDGDDVISRGDLRILIDWYGRSVPKSASSSPPPQVTISAGTSPVTEGTSATFTITVSPAPTSALTVNVDVSEDGDMINGTPSSSVTINANQTSATLTVNTDNDQADESNSVITAEVESGTGYTVGSSSSASVTVNDNDDLSTPLTPSTPPPPPQVTISAGTSPVTEGTSATFTISVSPAPASALTVNVDVTETGSVISGTAPSTVTINANATSATLTVNTVSDETDEPNSVVTAEVESGTGYTVGTSSSTSVTVNDDDTSVLGTPEVTISAGTSPVTEGTSATFTITASSAPTTAITVSVSVTEDGDVISGTAPSTVTIDANETTATLTVNTVNDQSDESNSVVTAEVESGTGYTVGSSSSASVTVEDNENPNLEVWEQTVDSASPVQGGQFTLSVRVVNTGKGKSAATTLRYYRSTDATITTGDTAVGTDEVGALWRLGSANESVDLTAPSTAGTYYYGACVDAVADESDTTDNCSASVEVDVQAPAKRVEISPRSLTFNALDETQTVTVKVLEANGDEDEDASWIWISFFSGFSSGISIEKVDGGMEITSTRTGRGRVDISSDGAKTAMLSVSVFQTPASLELSPSSKNLTVGGTVTLSAAIKDANSNDIQLSEGGRSGLVVYWETSDATVAMVAGVDADEDGNTGSTATVTAVAAGTATITGRWGSSISGTATITVTVTDN